MKSLVLILLLAIPAAAQDLYIVQGKGGSVTITSRKPPSSARFRIVRGKRAVFQPRPIKSSFTHLVSAVAWRYSIDPNLINAVIHVESAFRVKAVSPKGAMGLMQLMPATARSLGVSDPFNPLENIWGGVRYLVKMLDEFDGDLELALAAYNAGPNAVKKYNNQIPPYRETQRYVRKVLAARDMYRRESEKSS